MATIRRRPVRHCSKCGKTGHDRRAHGRGAARRNPRRRSAPTNPDWYRDKWGRPHPVRGTPDYEDGFVGMSRADKRYLKSGSDQPRGGYTQEARGRAQRATAPKRRSTAKRDTSAGERLASAKSRTQKANERARRVASRGF